MLKIQENKYNMARAVSTFLGENLETACSIPQLRKLYNLLNLKFNEIELKDNEHKTVRKGKHVLKRHLREDAIKKTLGISGAVNVFASVNGMIELRDNSKDKRRTFNKMRDMELLLRMKFIKEMAGEILPSLEEFGITQNKYEAFLIITDLYEESLGQTESSRAVQKGAKKTRVQLFKELDSILYSIDRLVDGLLEDNPGFVSNYRLTRRIFSPGVRHRQLIIDN